MWRRWPGLESSFMTTLSAWSPVKLIAVLLGYSIIAVGVFLAPLVAPVLREAWQARRAKREPNFVLFRSYPVYVLRFRRAFLFLLLAPPILLVAAWLRVRMR